MTVREWMVRERLAQEGLARKLDVSFASVNRWLMGKRPWPFEIVLRIKAMAGGALTDASFASRGQGKRKPNKAA